MSGNLVIALLFSIGFGGWLYAKTIRSTGGNTKSALTVAGAAGFVTFLVLLMILGLVLPN